MAVSISPFPPLKSIILALSFALLLTLATSESPPLRIQVMTYNIKQGPAFIFKEDQEQRLKELVKTLSSLYRPSSPPSSSSSPGSSAPPRPDVIVFQEMLTPKSFEAVREGFKSFLPYHTRVLGAKCPSKADCPSGKDCQLDGWNTLTGDCHNGVLSFAGGVAIFSRFPIGDVCEVGYSLFLLISFTFVQIY